jgi:hypothetical protein
VETPGVTPLITEVVVSTAGFAKEEASATAPDVGIKFPTAADMVIEDAVKITVTEPSIEELVERFQEELRPKGEELDGLRKMLREQPYWQGQVYVMVDFLDAKINTPAILERCLQQVRDDIGLPCYVSVVRMGDNLGISVKHPKIFVNR